MVATESLSAGFRDLLARGRRLELLGVFIIITTRSLIHIGEITVAADFGDEFFLFGFDQFRSVD